MTFQIEAPPVTIDQFVSQSYSDAEYLDKTKPNGTPYTTVDENGHRGHCAQDVNDTYGERTLYACFDGVAEHKWDDDLGYVTILRHADGSALWYCHQRRRIVDDGERVEAWEPIGVMGESGYASGVHLHLIGLRRWNDYGSIFNYSAQLRALKGVLMMLTKADVEFLVENRKSHERVGSNAKAPEFIIPAFRDMDTTLKRVGSDFNFAGPAAIMARTHPHADDGSATHP